MLGLEGTTLSHYRLQCRLGRGGMSEVYLATDEHLQRDVAIKLVNSSHEDYSARFQREVKTVGMLGHSHILPVLATGEHGPWHYLVMPYIKQGTLHQRLARGPLTLQEAGNVLEQVASALQFAHDRGILHRDIKPSNILLHDGQFAYLADFGLAKAIVDDNEITQTGCLMGTPEYMAPELIDQPASTSSDIYALGVLLYEMVTGQVPFKASTPVATCWKHLREQPVRPSLLNPAVSHPVEKVILCALEKNPRSRFKSARALVQAYKRALKAAEQPETMCVLAQDDTYPNLRIADQAQGANIDKINGICPPLHPGRERLKGAPLRAPLDGPAQALRQAALKRQFHSSTTHRLITALLALVFLLMISLSLGFFVASNAAYTSASAALGDVIPPGHSLQQKHAFLTSTASHSGAISQSTSGDGNGHGNGGRHHHKHGHQHDDGDDNGDGDGNGN